MGNVPVMGKYATLTKNIEEEIDYFLAESIKHKNMHRGLRVSTFFGAAFSTLLAGLASTKLGVDNQSFFNIAILVITATIGVVTSFEGLRKPAELWIHERSTYHALLDLQRDVLYFASNGSSDAELDEYFSRLQAILRSSGDSWKRFVQPVSPATSGQALLTCPHCQKSIP